ncbi:MAG TPA: type II toxin-antitoxin system YafQ family toxin [Chitinophagales bacterium]|jgi:mRNA interferase YafQ|nr:type II toxin-antitoxin system YafQ family toxin [Chitinophagales bacterium]HQV78072.1 type II toxin-antitoxin system YafQ family toxin [Chitinophagales bacterium]HQW80079.1 type II toxin-antitoxin system YafQ family toxin [Chitinophagales bacterium]HRB18769.1 type II toxin-antitoxin system YafQ family toxin [Chitinophagales bacterium]HRB66758.1 type II toxin-antitoxin system YafQ family toxin [Chitinophagales bacterium]
MYKILTNNEFEKDVKTCKKRGYNMKLLLTVIELLQKNGKLPTKYKQHKLSGNYKGFWECHIRPNWLLIWLQNDTNKEITLTNTGTHSDLF